MMRNVVSFHYVLRGPSGQVIDMSAGGAPVVYLEGAGQIIDGLDEQLRGAAAGSKQRVLVPAAKAYGPLDPALRHTIRRTEIPFEGELKIGDRFQTEPDPGAPVVTIAAIVGDEVTIDANHPLAGVDLTFEVEIVAVRAATPEEIRHGHVHGENTQGGGCGCGDGGCENR
jgi:FKBP-type peptidyl-prolyl cis-trans isomerase SlyD